MLYTRPALLESIATAYALSVTATTTPEYLHWFAREQDLRSQAGTITATEETAICKIADLKVAIYDGVNDR